MGTEMIDGVIQDARLARTLRTWRGLCAERFAPSRADIRPNDFRTMLGRIALIDVVAGEVGDARYRYRLMGTQLAAQDAFDMTGKPLSQHPLPQQREIVRAAFDEVVATGQPVYREDDGGSTSRPFSYARLVLPLSEDGTSVTGLMVARVEMRATAGA